MWAAAVAAQQHEQLAAAVRDRNGDVISARSRLCERRGRGLKRKIDPKVSL
jgi:hypothetical protein